MKMRICRAEKIAAEERAQGYKLTNDERAECFQIAKEERATDEIERELRQLDRTLEADITEKRGFHPKKDC